MNWMVRQSTELEVNMNACERVIEFTNLTPERPPIVPGELRETGICIDLYSAQHTAWCCLATSPSDASSQVSDS